MDQQGEDFGTGIFDENDGDTIAEATEEEHKSPEFDDFDFVDPSIEEVETKKAEARTKDTVSSEAAGSDDDGVGEDESANSEGAADQTAPIDEKLLRLAGQFGFTREQAKAFPDGDALQDALNTMGNFAKQLEEQSKSRSDGVQADEKPAEADGEFKLDLDTAEWDEDTVKVLTGMKDHFEGVIDQLKQDVGILINSQRAGEQKQREDRFERYIADLGEDYVPLVGKGNAADLDRSGDEYKARNDVWMEMTLISQAASMKGQVLSEREIFKKAMQSVHGDSISKIVKEAAEKQTRKAVKDQMGKLSSRPTQKSNVDAQHPEAKALNAVREVYAKRGLTD